MRLVFAGCAGYARPVRYGGLVSWGYEVTVVDKLWFTILQRIDHRCFGLPLAAVVIPFPHPTPSSWPAGCRELKNKRVRASRNGTSRAPTLTQPFRGGPPAPFLGEKGRATPDRE